MALTRAAHGPYEFDNTGDVPQGTGAYTTASFTPAANSLLVVFVCWGSDNVAGDISAGAMSDSTSLTWTKRVEYTNTWTTNEHSFTQCWTAPVGSSPAAMTLTFTHTGVNAYQIALYVYTYTGYAGTGATASGGTSASGTLTLTLSGTPATTSHVIGLGRMAEGSPPSSITPNAGETEIREDLFTAEYERYQTQSRTSSASTSFSWVFANRNGAPYDDVFGLAIEITAASTGLARPPFQQPKRFFRR